MANEALGEFEQTVLLAILHVGDGAYGVPVTAEIVERTGREVSASAVYVTLRRLEKKGLVSSWMSEPMPERGGKPRRLVKVEPEGVRLLHATRARIEAMWKGLGSHAADSA